MKNEEQRLNKKGFTLVELIIVMAIMAILVGALAPRVMQYVERSREARDLQLVNSVHTAVLTAIASDTTNATIPASGSLADYATPLPDVKELLGIPTGSNPDAVILGRCGSKIGKDIANHANAADQVLTITYDSTKQELKVEIGTTGRLVVHN